MRTSTVYLLCFAPGIPRGARPGNACHYLGSTAYDTPEQRLEVHLRGGGSPLVKAAHDRGLAVEVVASWPGNKQHERAMKRRHRLAHYCPRCSGRATATAGGYEVEPADD